MAQTQDQENMVEMSIEMSSNNNNNNNNNNNIKEDTTPFISSNHIYEPADYHPSQHRAIFDPPLAVQRYQWMQDYVTAHSDIESVTDFGCGNGRQLLWLKKAPQLQVVNFVDIDHYMLQDTLDHYFRPGLWEMLFGRQNTKLPLSIKVFHGDMSVPDDRLKTDCITLIEVIEHLELEDVEKAVRTIFGYYKPKSVVISTPNHDFNHLLRQEGESPSKFRHFDHKFEWSRQEFLNWCQQVCKHFPSYTFYLDGVGKLPGSEPFGPATQIAVFQRIVQSTSEPAMQDSEVCLDLLLDKLNVKEAIPEFKVDRERKKVSLISEFDLPGCVGEIPTNDTSQLGCYQWV